MSGRDSDQPLPVSRALFFQKSIRSHYIVLQHIR